MANRNYRLTVLDVSASPIQNADVEILDTDTTIKYQTPIYGGGDAKTDANGQIGIVVLDDAKNNHTVKIHHYDYLNAEFELNITADIDPANVNLRADDQLVSVFAAADAMSFTNDLNGTSPRVRSTGGSDSTPYCEQDAYDWNKAKNLELIYKYAEAQYHFKCGFWVDSGYFRWCDSQVLWDIPGGYNKPIQLGGHIQFGYWDSWDTSTAKYLGGATSFNAIYHGGVNFAIWATTHTAGSYQCGGLQLMKSSAGDADHRRLDVYLYQAPNCQVQDSMGVGRGAPGATVNGAWPCGSYSTGMGGEQIERITMVRPASVFNELIAAIIKDVQLRNGSYVYARAYGNIHRRRDIFKDYLDTTRRYSWYLASEIARTYAFWIHDPEGLLVQSNNFSISGPWADATHGQINITQMWQPTFRVGSASGPVIQDLDVKITDGKGTTVYASSGYGGSDGKTDANGQLDFEAAGIGKLGGSGEANGADLLWFTVFGTAETIDETYKDHRVWAKKDGLIELPGARLVMDRIRKNCPVIMLPKSAMSYPAGITIGAQERITVVKEPKAIKVVR